MRIMLVLVALIMASRASAGDYEDCRAPAPPRRTIANCSIYLAGNALPRGKRADAYNNRARAYAALLQHRQAISDYTTAMALLPESEHLHYNRGLSLQKIGKFQLALYDFNSANLINPSYQPAFSAAGSLLVRMKKYRLALGKLDAAITLNSKSVSDRFERGRVKFLLKRYTDAIFEYNAIIALSPKSYRAYTARAIIYSAMGQKVSASRDFRQALVIKPNYRKARIWLRRLQIGR